MDNHPAFMTEWDPSKPMTPELEALINLKYEQCEDLDGRLMQLYDRYLNHNLCFFQMLVVVD